jgi:hypothetical protein
LEPLIVKGKMMEHSAQRGRSQITGKTLRTLSVLTSVLLLARISLLPASSEPPRPSEFDVKAAYLLNFGRFMRHANQQPIPASFDICILGKDPIGRTIDSLAANEKIDSSPVRILRPPDVSNAKGCAIVFISALEADRIREDLALLSGSDALTVSDASDFLDRGGMIQFLVVENHVRFAVNLDAVNRAHLILSSELLRVASSVKGKPPTGEMP